MNNEVEVVVVTRHPALVAFLVEKQLVTGEPKVIAHATPEDVHGKHVIGVLPMHLACLAASVTEVPLALPAELRGQELSIEQMRQFSGVPVTYVVRTQEDWMAERKLCFDLGCAGMQPAGLV